MSIGITENRLFKNVYLIWAVYASLVPLSIILLLILLSAKQLNIQLSEEVMLWLFIAIWIVSYVLSALLLRAPFLRYFDKFRFIYDNSELTNFQKTVRIQNSDIEKIFVGHIRSKSVGSPIAKIHSPGIENVVSVSMKNCLTLILTRNRILFLDLTLLENGPELQERLLKGNQEKIQNREFDSVEFRKSHKLKWYEVLSTQT